MARKKASSEDEEAAAERRSPAMVLIVADDDDAGELMARVLGSRGFRTAKSRSVEETMHRMTEVLPRAVLLDLAASGIGSSLKVLESIRSHGDRKINRARVVLIARSSKNKVFSFQSGVDEFLVRPFHADELEEAVRSVIERPHDERGEYRRQQLEALQRSG